MFGVQDHRAMGKSFDLFHFQDEAPGAVFWHPKGFRMLQTLKETIREWTKKEGYQEVCTPQVLCQSLWETSGHWVKNSHKFYKIKGFDPMLAVKPVSCPAHIEIMKRICPHAEDLPIRLSEFGICHEADPGGEPDGLFRLIQFTVDDGHIFCREDQVESQVALFASSVQKFYASMGIEGLHVALALRPSSRLGDDAMWDRAESLLCQAANKAGLAVELEAGKGSFYGPKLDFTLLDSRKHSWMCGTIQLDLFMGPQFGLTCGTGRMPVVILHRAMVGSLERFLGILLEGSGSGLPPWVNCVNS